MASDNVAPPSMERASFPENPRVVAAPHDAMRPNALADDGKRYLYCSMSRHYGHTGCVITRYDTESGLANYNQDQFPSHMVISLFLATLLGLAFVYPAVLMY